MTARLPVPRRPPPRLFALFRREDVTGLSGTGLVTYGVKWPNGKVTTWWLADRSGVSQLCTWESLPDMLRIHGHGGRTTVVWLTADPDDELLDTAPLRVRWDAYRAVSAARDGLRGYEAAAALVDELGPLLDAYERLAAAFLEQRRNLGDTRAEADALRTALDITASLAAKQEGAS